MVEATDPVSAAEDQIFGGCFPTLILIFIPVLTGAICIGFYLFS